MRPQLLLGAILALILTGQAFAQAPSAVATARAMIEGDGVGDIFEAVEGDAIIVRHTASGLTCHFYGGETQTNLIVFSGGARGEDVGCNAERADQSVTLYATRYTPPTTPQQALADADAGIRNRFPDARPTPALLAMTSEDLPAPLARHFLITVRGEQWMTSAIVAQSGPWIIKLRYSAPARDADSLMRLQLEANAIFTLALVDMQN